MTKSHQPPKLGSMMPIQALLNPECLIGSSVHCVLRTVAIVAVFLDLSSHGIFWQSLKKGLNFLCILVGLTISGLTGQMWQRLQGERQDSETLPSDWRNQMLMYSHLVLEPDHGKSRITLTIQVAVGYSWPSCACACTWIYKDQSNLLDAVASSNEQIVEQDWTYLTWC